MEQFFTNVYEKCEWGDNKNSSYKGSSGGGSSIEININTYVPFLKKFIMENNIKSIVDLGCGDFVCGPLIYNTLDIKYTGYDTYEKVIIHNSDNNCKEKYNFYHLDFYNKKEEILPADLCILKDVLQHWKMDEIYNFLDYITDTKKYKYILICNCCNQKHDNPKNEERSTPLSVDFLPLKKYNPKKLFNYSTKEVSIIYI